MDETIELNLRKSFEVAIRAREKGNHPFGAVLTDREGNVLLEGENTVVTERDCTAHAETSLVREACREFDTEFLSRCTLYTSTEPCPMCAGAIYWSGVGKIVYGLSQLEFYANILGGTEEDGFILSCKDILSHGSRKVLVIGPLLEEDAATVHKGFWDNDAV